MQEGAAELRWPLGRTPLSMVQVVHSRPWLTGQVCPDAVRRGEYGPEPGEGPQPQEFAVSEEGHIVLTQLNSEDL